MSDSDSVDYEFLFQSNTASSEVEELPLDPSITLAQRQRNSEIEKQIREIEVQAVNASVQAAECSEEVVSIKQSTQSADLVQEIKYIHPGRSTFNTNESCCIFNEENLNIKDFSPSQDGISHMVFKLSDSEVRQFICRNQLKRVFEQCEVIHQLCLYLFFLASVHRDKRTVSCSASTILYMKEDWFPSVDTIFIVFVNWGIKSEFLNVESIEVDKHIPFLIKKTVGHPRKLDYNIQKILEVIGSSAREIAKATDDNKLNRLIYILVFSALEHRAHLTSYSRCICSLLRQIPEERWNYNRMQKVAELLFSEGTEHCHNLLIVCNSLLILGSQAQEVARFLACMTLNKLLSDEQKKEPLDWISCQKILNLLSHYNNLHEMKLYYLYIVVKLVDFCIHSDYDHDKLTLDEIHVMIIWLSNFGGNILTLLESIDCINLKELISRCLSSWRIMMSDIEELNTLSLCNINASEGFENSED